MARYPSEAWKSLPITLENHDERENITSIITQELSDVSCEYEVEIQKSFRVEGIFHEEKRGSFNKINSKHTQRGCLPGGIGCKTI